MRALEEGIYRIQLALGVQPSIGVDGSGSIQPVFTGGKVDVWIVEKLNSGLYSLYIENGEMPLFIHDKGRTLFGDDIPPPGAWSILPQDDGTYTIQVPNQVLPPTYWTVGSPNETKYPVTLESFDIPFPQQNQKWYFDRLSD